MVSISSLLQLRGEEVDAPARLLRVSNPSPMAPAATVGMVARPARVRSWDTGLLPLRLLNRRTGQPRLAATAASFPAGLVGPRVADQVHQRDVLVAVGVEVALGQVDPVGSRRTVCTACLALPGPQMIGSSTSPVIRPSLVDLELVAQHVVDAQEPGHRFHLHRQRRRAQHHGVAARHVRALTMARISG